MILQGGKTPAEQIAWGFQRALLRKPKEGELATLVKLYTERLEAAQANPAEAALLATQPLGPLPAGIEIFPAAAQTAVAGVILNLDEFLTKP